MQVQLIPGRGVDTGLAKVWRELQLSNPELASPCFAPEFTQTMAAVREDIGVALVQDGTEIVAIFPFQRRKDSLGLPVGGIVSDYEGLICRPGFNCDAQELLRECRLGVWDFDHLLASQSFFTPFHDSCEGSPC